MGAVRYTDIKKSQKRRSRPPLRGRSLFPAGSHSLPNLGEGRMPARNSRHRAEKGFESLWHDRDSLRPVSLPFSRSLQCLTYIVYLERLIRSFFPQKIYLIQDNASYHKDGEV